jgi:hypothetical protein
MDMRMKEQISGPGMQDSGDAKLGVFAQPLRVSGQGQERVGGRSEQEGEDLLLRARLCNSLGMVKTMWK